MWSPSRAPTRSSVPTCFRDREDRRVYAGLDGDAQIYRLNFTDFELTLGWQLSDVTQGLIAAHAGSPSVASPRAEPA